MTRSTLALAVALLVVGLLYGCEMKARGRAEADGARWRSELAALRGRTARVDTVWRVQTKTFTRWRDSVVTLRDSLTVTDTVEVLRFIAVQDSTIASCQALILTCEQRVALRDSSIRTLERQWASRERPPNAFRRTLTALGWASVGYLAGTAARR